jgi:hypothetical protein
VFSAWLLEFLKAKKVSLGVLRLKGDGTKERRRKESPLDSFKLKRVCDCCNTGWMSRLEGRAKPLIEGLMSGRTHLESLDGKQRQLLARWAGKTAIIESHAVGAECPVDGKLLRWMRDHEDAEPGRFAVVSSSINYVGIGHMQVGLITDLLDGKTIAGNIVVLVFPNLILTCGFPYSDLGYECRCDLSFYRPLWPDGAAWKAMADAPPSQPPDGDGGDILAGLAMKIELFHPIS